MGVFAPSRPPSAQAKPAARRPLLFIGIAMALLAFVLVLALGSILARGATAASSQTTVIVAAQNIAAGGQVTASDLTTMRMPLSAVPPATVDSASKAVGKVAQVAIPKGAAITTNLVAPKGYMNIPSGWVAETIQGTELVAVAGYVQKNDSIDIIATLPQSAFNTSGSNSSQVTKTVFTDVRVFRVGTEGSAAQGAPSSLTVLLTPCDAQYLSWMIKSQAQFNYSLVSGLNAAPAPSGPSASCPIGTSTPAVGPSQVNARFQFTS
jgi:Flp pilus assembly protein CpaB